MSMVCPSICVHLPVQMFILSTYSDKYIQVAACVDAILSDTVTQTKTNEEFRDLLRTVD